MPQIIEETKTTREVVTFMKVRWRLTGLTEKAHYNFTFSAGTKGVSWK
jgi:hypothetical protein